MPYVFLFIGFPIIGPNFEVKIVDPQIKLAQVASLSLHRKMMSRQSIYVYPLVVKLHLLSFSLRDIAAS